VEIHEQEPVIGLEQKCDAGYNTIPDQKFSNDHQSTGIVKTKNNSYENPIVINAAGCALTFI
jgi:hypothetical protein